MIYIRDQFIASNNMEVIMKFIGIGIPVLYIISLFFSKGSGSGGGYGGSGDGGGCGSGCGGGCGGGE